MKTTGEVLQSNNIIKLKKAGFEGSNLADLYYKNLVINIRFDGREIAANSSTKDFQALIDLKLSTAETLVKGLLHELRTKLCGTKDD